MVLDELMWLTASLECPPRLPHKLTLWCIPSQACRDIGAQCVANSQWLRRGWLIPLQTPSQALKAEGCCLRVKGGVLHKLWAGEQLLAAGLSLRGHHRGHLVTTESGCRGPGCPRQCESTLLIFSRISLSCLPLPSPTRPGTGQGSELVLLVGLKCSLGCPSSVPIP